MTPTRFLVHYVFDRVIGLRGLSKQCRPSSDAADQGLHYLPDGLVQIFGSVKKKGKANQEIIFDPFKTSV